MLYSYVLENSTEKLRENTPIFNLINELDLGDDEVFFDLDDSEGRSELHRLIDLMETGDRLAIRSICDLADSMNELMEILSQFAEKQISLCSCIEPFLSGTHYLDMFNCLLGVEQYYTNRKRQVGFKKAVAEGKVGRPKSKGFDKAIKLFKDGVISVEQAVVLTGLSKTTIYRYVKE